MPSEQVSGSHNQFESGPKIWYNKSTIIEETGGAYLNQEDLKNPVNPYHYITHCIGGKWKMTILHHIHTYGSIRFNHTLRTLPISEKVFSHQLRELAEDGLVERIQYNTIPLKVEYVLTPLGKEVIPALDILYIWSIKQMDKKNIPIDPDAFIVHMDDIYVSELEDIMKKNKVDFSLRPDKDEE